MIVRNEAHIVERVLDAVAPYVSSWVIVDTGSDDGTQDVIRNHMARLGIPGELYERPWCNFGHKLEADVNVWQLCGCKAGSYPRPRALHELSISIVHAFFLAFGAMMARTQLLNVE
jgi:glycosyltransferase involved in cell wall biosynthesis